MESEEAQAQLQMVERIIAASSRQLLAGGEFFIAWGLVGAALDTLFQVVINQIAPVAALWGAPAILAAAIAFTILRGRHYRRESEGSSFLQREFYNVLWLTLGVTFVVQIAASHIFVGWAEPALSSFGASIVLFYIGIHGNRRAAVGGIVTIVSLVVANYEPGITGYVLGTGMLAGYGGFGLTELLARRC